MIFNFGAGIPAELHLIKNMALRLNYGMWLLTVCGAAMQ